VKALGYIWRVAVNLFYLLVVGIVLAGIRDPSEKAIVSVLGLLYVTIRSLAIGQGLAAMLLTTSFQNQIDQIRHRVDGTFEIPNRSEEEAATGRMQTKFYIDGFFLAIISLVCLYAFFTAHS
jgi:hypothetical protein